MTRQEFYNFIREYIEKDPVAAGKVGDYVTIGLNTALSNAQHRAADMEAALMFALAPRIRNRREQVSDKLLMWKGKTTLRWGSIFKEMK